MSLTPKEDTHHEASSLEEEYEAFILAGEILSRIQWESQYYSYDFDNKARKDGYRPKAIAHNEREIYKWYLEEELRKEHKRKKYISRQLAKNKLEDTLNIIFARIEAGIPPPEDIT